MIPDKIGGFVFALLNGLLGTVPPWSPPVPSLTTWSASMGYWVGQAEGFFPVSHLAICLASVLAFMALALGWRAAFFVYGLIPFKAS